MATVSFIIAAYMFITTYIGNSRAQSTAVAYAKYWPTVDAAKSTIWRMRFEVSMQIVRKLVAFANRIFSRLKIFF